MELKQSLSHAFWTLVQVYERVRSPWWGRVALGLVALALLLAGLPDVLNTLGPVVAAFLREYLGLQVAPPKVETESFHQAAFWTGITAAAYSVTIVYLTDAATAKVRARHIEFCVNKIAIPRRYDVSRWKEAPLVTVDATDGEMEQIELQLRNRGPATIVGELAMSIYTESNVLAGGGNVDSDVQGFDQTYKAGFFGSVPAGGVSRQTHMFRIADDRGDPIQVFFRVTMANETADFPFLLRIGPSLPEQRADQSLQSGDSAAAIQSAHKAVNRRPRSVTARKLLVAGLIKNAQYRDAISILRKTIEFTPDDRDLYSRLEYCFRLDHDFEEVLRTVNEALSRFPDDLWFLNQRQWALVHLDRHAEARSTGEAIQRAQASSFEYQIVQAKELGQIGKEHEALRHAKRALELRPSATDAHIRLAQIYLRIEDYAAVLAACEAAIKLGVVAFDLYCCKAAAYHKTGNHDEELAAIASYTVIAPQEAAGWNALADMYINHMALEMAESTVRRSLDLDTSQARVYLRLAWILHYLGRATEALAAVTKACDLAPDRNYYKLVKFEFLLRSERVADAVDVIEEIAGQPLARDSFVSQEEYEAVERDPRMLASDNMAFAIHGAHKLHNLIESVNLIASARIKHPAADACVAMAAYEDALVEASKRRH